MLIAPLVLIMNNIVSTEMSSNAAAEHIGHMSKIITNNEKQRMLPVTALHELMAHYILPTLVDVVDLNLHKQLAALWYKIGGRNPCGSDLTRKFVRKKKLLSHLTQPVMKNNTSTLYHKGKLRKIQLKLLQDKPDKHILGYLNKSITFHISFGDNQQSLSSFEKVRFLTPQWVIQSGV